MSGPRALTRYDTSLKAPRLSSKSLAGLPPKPVVIRRCASMDVALNARCSIPTRLRKSRHDQSSG
jgi:hypothetical protein